MICVILYYTATQKTKVFAQALGDVLNRPIYELKTKLGEKIGFKFIFQSLYLALTGKMYPVDNMPEAIAENEIYLCAPVWGGNPAAPAWYFLNHADLKGKKVNLILTCGNVTSAVKYRKKALDALALVDCVPGAAYVFATTDTPPDRETVASQLRDMLPS